MKQLLVKVFGHNSVIIVFLRVFIAICVISFILGYFYGLISC